MGETLNLHYVTN